MLENQQIVDQLSVALENLANAIIAVSPNEATYMEMWGWNLPAVTKTEFAGYVKAPTKKLQSLIGRQINLEDATTLQGFIQRAQLIQSTAIPNLPSVNAFHVYLTVRSFIDTISDTISKYGDESDWQKIENDKLVPRTQLRRLKNIENQIDKLAASSEDVETKLLRINNADAAAKQLPETLESLGEARDEFIEAKAEIDANKGAIESTFKASKVALEKIQMSQERAAELVELTEQARAAAVTQGLGAAFAGRAATLQVTTAILGVLLALTLLLGWNISSNRITAIHELMGNPATSIKLLWANFALVLTSVGAPVWFAWLLSESRLVRDSDLQKTMPLKLQLLKRMKVIEKKLLGTMILSLRKNCSLWL